MKCAFLNSEKITGNREESLTFVPDFPARGKIPRTCQSVRKLEDDNEKKDPLRRRLDAVRWTKDAQTMPIILTAGCE
jgi:hypothetical protein